MSEGQDDDKRRKPNFSSLEVTVLLQEFWEAKKTDPCVRWYCYFQLWKHVILKKLITLIVSEAID